MHEAGIAASILEICEARAREHGALAIQAIGVTLGELSGVVPEALEFAFEALKAETLARTAELRVERVPLDARCQKCGWAGRPDGDLCLLCPACDGALQILSGREMQVNYVELEEESECSASP